MNSFLKSLGILIVSLVLLASGLNLALDRIACPTPPSRVVIASNGETMVYVGVVTRLAEITTSDATLPAHLLRHMKPGDQPISSEPARLL